MIPVAARAQVGTGKAFETELRSVCASPIASTSGVTPAFRRLLAFSIRCMHPAIISDMLRY